MAIKAAVNNQDPRVKRTRRLLQDAFKSLVCEETFEAISVQDIATRATVNRATFYAHYKDKFDLVDSIFREEFEERLARNFPEATSLTVNSLQTLCETVFDFLALVYGRCQFERKFSPLLERPVRETLTKFIAGRLAQNRPTAKAERATVESTALVMSSAIFGSGIEWARGARKTPAKELAGQVVAVLTGGMSAAIQGFDQEKTTAR